MKHQLDATLCRFYFCRVTLHVSGASAHHQEYLKLVQRPLVHVFLSAYLIVPDGCIRSVQFSFYVLVVVYLSCLFGIAKFSFFASLYHSISQMKHQLDATLCRFYFCRVTLHVSGASTHHQEYLKLVQWPLVHVYTLQK